MALQLYKSFRTHYEEVNVKKLSVFLLCLVMAVAVSFAYAAENKPKGDLRLLAKKVSSPPADADSPQWKEAVESRLVLEGAGTFENKSLNLSAKAVYTKDEIFLLFVWPDEEASLVKGTWKLQGGKWIKQKGDEDRVGVTWEINRIEKFATKGCAVLCHNESKNRDDWYYAVNSPAEKGDMWHWKAYRSNPMGYADDGYVTVGKKPEEGRKGDAGTGKAKKNETKDKSNPLFKQDPNKPASIKGFLLADEAIEIKDYSGFKEGDQIPQHMLSKFGGSFGDVKAKGVWKDKKWTLILHRKLNTGQEDDVAFNPDKVYTFGAAVFNNSHDEDSYNSAPLKLEFK